MSRNIWDEEEFRDSPVEHKDGEWQSDEMQPHELPKQVRSTKASISQDQPKQAKRIMPDFSAIEEMTQEIQEENDDSEDFSGVLNDARLRLEQGRLYEMVMNHNIFNGLDADPIAIKNVQKEIRKFAKERMEIMLGMRNEASVQNSIVNVKNQFNDLEFELLKQLTFKMSQGKTGEQQPEVTAQVVRKTGLNSIGSSQQKQTKSMPQEIIKKTSSPIKRIKIKPEVEQVLAEEGVSKEEIELEYVPLNKPISELTPKEQAERIRQTQERLSKNKRVDNPNKIPMPSFEVQAALAESRTAAVNKSPIGTILANLNNRTPKQ